MSEAVPALFNADHRRELLKLLPAFAVDDIEGIVIQHLQQPPELLDEGPIIERLHKAATALLAALDETGPYRHFPTRYTFQRETRIGRRFGRPGRIRGMRFFRALIADVVKASEITAVEWKERLPWEFERELSKPGRPASDDPDLVAAVACVCAAFGIAPSAGSKRFLDVLGVIWRARGLSVAPTHAARVMRQELRESAEDGAFAFSPSGRVYWVEMLKGGGYRALTGRAAADRIQETRPGCSISLAPENMGPYVADS